MGKDAGNATRCSFSEQVKHLGFITLDAVKIVILLIKKQKNYKQIIIFHNFLSLFYNINLN